MSDFSPQLFAYLAETILPRLKSIQASQTEQRAQSEQLNRNLNEFRSEMQIRLAEIRAEIAYCRQEVENLMVNFAESETAGAISPTISTRKTRIH